MASQTKAEDDCFRWKCPFLACNETFRFAWARGNHIKTIHPKKRQKEEETATEPALPGAADAQQASSADTTDTAGLAPNKRKFIIPDNATFEMEVPIRAAASSEDKSVTEGDSSDGPDTPEESDTSSTQENSRRPPQKYTLSIGGDFTVVLGTEEEGQVEVLVFSQALCMSSPVWEKICSNGFDETTQRRATFAHDDADAMLLLLHIAHLKFAHVPTNMSRTDLVVIAKVCEKYDNGMLLRPWMRGWIAEHKKNWNESKPEKLLLVFWVFGDASGFERAAKRLVLLGTCENGPRTLSMSSGVSFNELFQVSQAIGTCSSTV
ncbi:hypothetical protein F5882DRAFT_127702 [Hyaloscypha sp. PMI_1271]|nr:hypothetical protein F5882DRAFT_127702 [Hyaloscypha sp. PMI_1271]